MNVTLECLILLIRVRFKVYFISRNISNIQIQLYLSSFFIIRSIRHINKTNYPFRTPHLLSNFLPQKSLPPRYPRVNTAKKSQTEFAYTLSLSSSSQSIAPETKKLSHSRPSEKTSACRLDKGRAHVPGSQRGEKK